MSAESILYDALSEDEGIEDLVSDRIFPGLIPQGKSLPAIVTRRTDTDYVLTIHSNTPVGVKVDLEIWCIAMSNTAAEAIADAVEAALAVAEIAPTGRRPDIDPATESHASVISCVVWP